MPRLLGLQAIETQFKLACPEEKTVDSTKGQGKGCSQALGMIGTGTGLPSPPVLRKNLGTILFYFWPQMLPQDLKYT